MFSQRRTLLLPVTVEAIEKLKSSIKLINYDLLVMFTLLRHQYPAVAHILTHSVNLAFGLKSGFKNKCQDRAGFRLLLSGLVRFKA